MGEDDAVVAVFADHAAAKAAIKADDFRVMAKAVLRALNPKQIELHLMTPAASLARESASA